MLNTYYPPNQPTPKRCYNLGQALCAAIESWDKDIRVGILASGGLSHFVVDEELDQQALAGMQAKSVEQLMALPREKINSGSSEIRNWIVVTGATEHLDMDVVDYVPCYRSPAGTGCGDGVCHLGVKAESLARHSGESRNPVGRQGKRRLLQAGSGFPRAQE